MHVLFFLSFFIAFAFGFLGLLVISYAFSCKSFFYLYTHLPFHHSRPALISSTSPSPMHLTPPLLILHWLFDNICRLTWLYLISVLFIANITTPLIFYLLIKCVRLTLQ
jgi:hypothetical protein